MFHNSKKGFTIVELVIVIAVVAVLAAVLIPTFAGIIEKANLSKDQQAVANMNKDLAMEDALVDFEYASDAVKALATYGFYGDKFDAFTKGYYYAYDAQQKMMYLLDGTGAPIFPDNKAKNENLWGLYNDTKYDLVPGIKQYVALSSVTNEIEFNDTIGGVKSGTTFDLGGKVITFSTTISNIKIVNGSILSGVTGYDATNAKTLTEKEMSGSQSDAYIKSSSSAVVYPVFNESDVVYNGCVIAGKYQITGSKNVTFKNCTFVDSGSGYALTIGRNGADSDSARAYTGTITIENCTFESDRGINIQTHSADANVIIKDCEFRLADTSKMAIQIVSSCSITISGNKFLACKTAIRLNDDCNLSDASMVTFSNNVLGDGVKTVIDDDGNKNGEMVRALADKFN